MVRLAATAARHAAGAPGLKEKHRDRITPRNNAHECLLAYIHGTSHPSFNVSMHHNALNGGLAHRWRRQRCTHLITAAWEV